jgi:hypothetical protein
MHREEDLDFSQVVTFNLFIETAPNFVLLKKVTS